MNNIGVLVTAMLMAATNMLNGQNYLNTPNDTIDGVVPYNDIYHFNIFQTNLTTGELIFSYQKINVDYPSGWTANLCDNGTCFDGFPNSGTMDTVFNGDVGLMSIGVNPGDISGTSIFQYAIWEASTPYLIDTLTWFITAEEPLSVIEDVHAYSHDFLVYVLDKNIVLQTSLKGEFEYQITNINGLLVTKGIATQNTFVVELPNLNKGIYFVTAAFDQNSVVTKKIIITY